MSLAAINGALAAAVQGLALSYPVAWEGKTFKKPGNAPYLAVWLLPALQDAMQTVDKHAGILQVDICHPLNAGSPALLQDADAVLAYFRPGTRFVNGDQVVTVRKRSASQVMQLDGWLQISVSVSYVAAADVAMVPGLEQPEYPSAHVPISCAYPLDATQEEISGAYPGVVKLPMSNGDQTGTITINSGAGTVHYLAFPANATLGTSMKADLSSGKKVLGFSLAGQALASSSGTNQRIRPGIATIAGGVILDVQLDAQVGTAEMLLTIFDGGGGIFTDSHASTNEQLAVEFDTTTSTFAIRRNGNSTPLTLARNSFTPQQAILVINGDVGSIESVDDGKTLSATHLTSIGDIPGPVTAGFTDICGNS